MADVRPGPVHFREAIDFFRAKTRLPTRAWTDIWEGMHSQAFVVAGAMRDELLADFQGAIARALEQGTTLAEFRRDFDAIVERHGWSYRGSRGWRSRVIYDTNLRTARAAGRWAQIERTQASRPYLRYVAVLDSRTRPEHRAWHGTVLPVDDPWWRTHYPPNGWNCRCTVQTLSRRDLDRYGYQVSEAAAPSPTVARQVAGRTIRVPEGIDPGFAYNPGLGNVGETPGGAVMAAWRRDGGRPWMRLTPGDWRSAGRPAEIPVDPPKARLGRTVRDRDELTAAAERAIGGREGIFRAADGSTLGVSAADLGRHLDLGRAPFLPLIKETIEDPFEIWLSFERHQATGRVVLRKRFVKAVRLASDRFALLVAQTAKGRFEAYTFLTTRDASYVQKQRAGTIIYRRDGS